MTHPGTQSASKKECIDLCRECADTCLETVNHCLSEAGEHAEQKHIVLLQTCADICETSARAMLLDSEKYQELCSTCAVICDACADDCEAFKDDSFMKECADICRRCAESCRVMAGSSHNPTKNYRKTQPTQSASM